MCNVFSLKRSVVSALPKLSKPFPNGRMTLCRRRCKTPRVTRVQVRSAKRLRFHLWQNRVHGDRIHRPRQGASFLLINRIQESSRHKCVLAMARMCNGLRMTKVLSPSSPPPIGLCASGTPFCRVTWRTCSSWETTQARRHTEKNGSAQHGWFFLFSMCFCHYFLSFFFFSLSLSLPLAFSLFFSLRFSLSLFLFPLCFLLSPFLSLFFFSSSLFFYVLSLSLALSLSTIFDERW